MKRSKSLRLFLAVLTIVGGLIACNCGGVPLPQNPAPPGPPANDPNALTDIKPRFVIDTGLMDSWGLKKTGPTHMQVSPDGKYLLTLAMSNKENVQVWDLATKKKLHGIRTEIGTMHGHIAIAPDSKTAAYLQLMPTGAPIIFDMVTGKTIRTIPDNQRIISNSPHRSMHFTPDGKRVMLACKNQVVGWDIGSGQSRAGWAEPFGVDCLTPFFDHGTKIATSVGHGGQINIRDAKGRVIKTLQGGSSSIAITPDEKSILTQGNGKVLVWDLATGDLRKEFTELSGTYQHIVTLPDNRTAIWPTNVGIIVVDLQAGTKKQQLKMNDPYMRGLAATPDGQTLLTADSDGLIKGWRLNANGMVE